ncbi:MAG: glycosyltransferase family 2 protein [Candidatus Omnitrophica bacterium]|nr:glycosyltransferase family 2 protein [Candidatus Omnitrophota bacterium]
MPAYNASKTLRETYEKVPRELVNEIILVDDASRDDTFAKAQELGIFALRHQHNLGYGGNQKTCYTEALRRGADVVVMIHPDGQYDPSFLEPIVQPIIEGRADVVLGSRMLNRQKALEGGMPVYKFISNIFLTACENLVLGQRLSEYHTGYRAYSRKFLETIPYMRNSNDFVFDTQVLVQASHFRMRIAEIPVTTRYFTEASSVGCWTSVVYGLKTLATLFQYLLHRAKILSCRLYLY